MLSKFTISNFKCFDEVSLILAPITILMGANSSGKSSIIQAILLLAHQVTYPDNAPLTSDVVNIGTFNEMRNFITNRRQIVITLESGNNACEMRVLENDELEAIVEFERRGIPPSDKLNLKDGSLSYLSANRLGHQNLYQKKYMSLGPIGSLGQFAMDYFEKNKSTPAREQLISDVASNTFSSQVNYWLREIVGTELITEDIVGTDSIKAMYSQFKNKSVRPKNVGSGISYLISILIVCLSSRENEIIIIENPEIHLHPRAQARLADFFAFIAKAGIQIIIETHSDHIFNGIRRNIKEEKIRIEDTSLNFFEYCQNDSRSNIIQVEISSSGAVINPLPGLFDQFSADLDSLLGI